MTSINSYFLRARTAFPINSGWRPGAIFIGPIGPWRRGSSIVWAQTPGLLLPEATRKYTVPNLWKRVWTWFLWALVMGVRKEVVQKLQRYFDVRTYGSRWPGGWITFEESIQLFSRAKVVLGMGGVNVTDAVKTLKGRDFEVPMCGAAYLTSSNSEAGGSFCHRTGDCLLFLH